MIQKFLKKILGDNVFIYIRAVRSKIFVGKEEREAIEVRKKLYATFVKKGDLCFDVGANIGNRIEPLLQLGVKVVAVEPQTSCAKFLQYKYGNRISLVQKGLGSEETVKDFYISDVSVLSTFATDWLETVKDGRFKEASWSRVEKMTITTLDALIKEYGHPALVKIDVEGYELEVIKGLSTPVKAISFEYAVPEQTEKLINCITHIQQNDPNIECNYCVGESMQFAMDKWLSPNDMKELVRSKAFIATSWGDIYVRSKK